MVTVDNYKAKASNLKTWKIIFVILAVCSLVFFIISFVGIFYSRNKYTSVFFCLLSFIAFIVFVVLTIVYFGKERRMIKEGEYLVRQKEDYIRQQKNYEKNLDFTAKKLGLIYRGYVGNTDIYISKQRIYFLSNEQKNVMVNYCNSIDSNKNAVLNIINKESIVLNDILYYSKEGDVQFTTQVAGGGGGGASVGGAVVGGLIAGGIGAVIGGRKSVNPIYSYDVEHDTRETFIRYNLQGKTLEKRIPQFVVYEVLFEIIPEKDLININTLNKIDSNGTNVNTNKTSLESKLEQLDDLYKRDVINEEEYNYKRKQIIDEM